MIAFLCYSRKHHSDPNQRSDIIPQKRHEPVQNLDFGKRSSVGLGYVAYSEQISRPKSLLCGKGCQ